MTAHWKKMAMLMLVGLLAAGPIAPPHAAAQMGEGYDRAMSATQAALDKATKAQNDMTMHMDAMMKMPMSGNEKAMTQQMQQMADAIKSLVETNRQLLEALKELKKLQK
jgi:transposase